MYQPNPQDMIPLLELQGRGALRDDRSRQAEELSQHALTRLEPRTHEIFHALDSLEREGLS